MNPASGLSLKSFKKFEEILKTFYLQKQKQNSVHKLIRL